ncbi:MAG: magnesium transporter CorA family protein [Bacteroidia bacterium]|nr:magnesium transporter CorA family protein [Bacteroidia bacterium]
MSESKFYHFSATGLFYGVGTLEEAITASREGGFVWFNFYHPSKEEFTTLVGTIGIHPLSVEDCFDEKQVPKIEYFPNNTFIIFNAFSYAERSLFIDEINLFIGKNFLITVSGHNSGTRKPLNNIEVIIESGHTNAKAGPDFLMHIVLDYLVDQKYKAFDDMEDELEEAEESLLNEVEKFQPRQLIRLRKDLLMLRKSLFHEREILIKICRLDCPYVTEKAIVHYRDIYDHLAKFFELTETYREIETSLMELYTSLLNNLMTKMSNETNSSVRRLTLIATIFMPLTLIASIGGMSEWSMMTGTSNWKTAYPLFLLGMVVLGVLNLLLIKRLEKKRKSGNVKQSDN